MTDMILPTPLVSVEWLAAHLGHPDLVVLDAQCLYLAAEQLGAGQHMRQVGIGGADFFVEIEAAGSRDLHHGRSTGRCRRRLHMGIQHHQIRVAEVRRQPFHSDQRGR